MEMIHTKMTTDGVLSGGKLAIMDGLAGKGLFAHFDIPKHALITFFGIPANPLDSYSYEDKRDLPEEKDHIYLLNGFLHNNAADAGLFTDKSENEYVPVEDVGYKVGLGWAANSSRGNTSTTNCRMKKLHTYPLCPHLSNHIRSPRDSRDYWFLIAIRDIKQNEEILHDYVDLHGNLNRKANRSSLGPMHTGVDGTDVLPPKAATKSGKKRLRTETDTNGKLKLTKEREGDQLMEMVEQDALNLAAFSEEKRAQILEDMAMGYNVDAHLRTCPLSEEAWLSDEEIPTPTIKLSAREPRAQRKKKEDNGSVVHKKPGSIGLGLGLGLGFASV